MLEAVILILKHATLLRLSKLSPQLALTHADLAYQKANIDSKVEQHLRVSSEEHSAFIMATDIGVFVLGSVKIISQ